MAKKPNLIEHGTVYTPEDVRLLYEWPHLIGHLVGKTKLFDVHSRWIKYMWEDNPEFRALRAFRGSYKSTACVHIGTIYYHLFVDPNARIFIIRKKFTDSSDALETIYDMMMTDEMQSLFRYVHGKAPKAIIKRKEKITWSFKESKTPEGSLNAFGIDNAITGRHGDRFILDDFTSLKDRISHAERESTKEMVREIQTNIVDPGKPVGFMGTPWHKEDAWTICPEPWDFPIGTIPGILSDEEIINKRKLTTGALWAANYELKHVPDDDALFRDPHYGIWRQHGIELVRAQLDAAWDGDHWNAFTIMAKRADGKIQAVGKSFPGNVKLWMGELVTFCNQYGVRRVYIEDNPDKGYTADDLKARGINATPYTETRNKHVKISTFLLERWNDIIWDENETDAEYMNQILDYREKQEPDDAPDSAASLISHCFSKKMTVRSERYRW
jgi:hypothetical protein